MRTGTVRVERFDVSGGGLHLRERWFSSIAAVMVIAGIVFVVALLAAK
jgi:hypothetical protein